MSWRTGGSADEGVAIVDALENFGTGYDRFSRTLTLTDPSGGAAPGGMKVRIPAFLDFALIDVSTGSGTYAEALNDFDPATYHSFYSNMPVFYEFEELGTYVVNYAMTLTLDDNSVITDDADLIFHVGPIAELAVWDGGASPLAGPGQRAYTIHAASKGPDRAPAVAVTLADVPQGAEVIVTEGTYQEGSCTPGGVCGGVWDLGEMGVSAPRLATGRLPYPTLTLITDAFSPGDITASIKNTEDYSVTIDGAVHSTNYFDYVEENDAAIIEARPGTGAATPGSPQGLRLLAYSNPPAAIVSWDEVASLNRRPVAGYQVHESASPCVRPAFDATATAFVKDPRHVDTGADAGEDKCYAVRAVNEQGVAGYWTFTEEPPTPPRPGATVPGAPGLPQLVAGDGSLTASWDAPYDGGGPIVGYVAQLTEQGQGWESATEERVSGTSADFTGLTNGTIYWARVRAVNALGQGDWSAESAAIPAVIPPASFSPPTLKAGSGRIRVEWEGPTIRDPDTPFDRYEIRWKERSAGWDGAPQVVFYSTFHRHTIWNLTNGTEYEVQVRGVNVLGQGVWSASAFATPTAPGAPRVQGQSFSTLGVRWEAQDGAVTGYAVRYREGASGSWSDHAHNGRDTSTTIAGLEADTGYEVQVQAAYAEGSSGWSESGTGRTDPAPPANRAPTITNAPAAALWVAENSAIGTGLHVFTATDPEGDGIGWSLEGDDAGSFSIDAGGQLTTNADLDYEQQAQYAFTVQASDGQGGTDRAAVTVSVTDVGPPDAPGAPTVAAVVGGGLSVSWEAPANAGPAITDYDVRYRETGASSWTDHAHDGTDTSTTIAGLEAGVEYQVQARASSAEGSGDWSASGTGRTNPAAYFYPTSGDRVAGVVARSGSEGCADDDWIWSCLGEAEPDGDASMITLALAGAVRLGFTVDSDDVPGAVTDVRFEVSMAASSRTMEPGDYGFTVYAGDDEVATVDGPDTVGTDYADVAVSGATITDELKENLGEAELEIQAPSRPYLQLTRVRMVVEYQPDGN